jgi:regulatory protein
MPAPRRPLPPLNSADLERYALRYVERYATTRAKLAAYLSRKLRERGWGEEKMPNVEGLAERMAELGYVNDRLYAESKAGAMARRGLGARRVRQALRFDGVQEGDAEAALAPEAEGDGVASALAFARRRRIGPYGREAVDRPMQEKQMAAMIRAGHSPSLARTIVRMMPGDDPEDTLAGG